MVKLCEQCGKRVSRYICQECGRAICELCIEPATWLCLDCYGRLERNAPRRAEPEEEMPTLSPVLKLFFVAFLLMVAGIIILMLLTIISGITKVSGLILFLGPIPIIFGVGENLTLLLIIATILTISCIVVFMILNKRIVKP